MDGEGIRESERELGQWTAKEILGTAEKKTREESRGKKRAREERDGWKRI